MLKVKMVCFAAIVIMSLNSVQTASADVQPNEIQAKAMKSISSDGAGITKLAYVTSNSFTKLEYVKGTVYQNNAFHLTYRFYYKDSDGDPQTYGLRFEYSAAGKMTNVVVTEHSSFWPPFNAIKIAGVVLDEVIKELDK